MSLHQNLRRPLLSISLNLKKGIDALSETIHQPKIKKWLVGLLVAIPLLGIGSYAGYNQLVTVPKQRAQNKIQTAANKYESTGKLKIETRKIILTKEGKLFADGIAADLFF